jgi:acyl-[acyl carrier protein]--UDP-N-acetylglucosamine O-acyltransferase
MFLTEDDLTELTGKRQNAARIRVLNSMGIQHKMRPDGSLAVLRSHVERLFGEKPTREEKPQWTPPWEQ